MKRHLQRFHKAVHDNLIKGKDSQPTLDVFFSKQSGILDLCTDIAIDGRPFRQFDSPSMKTLVGFASLGAKEPKLVISSAKVRKAVVERAKQMRQKISQFLKGEIISVSGDFATLHGNDFLGKSLNQKPHLTIF